MKAKFLRVITKVGKMSDIDLKLSDIKAYRELKKTEGIPETVVMLCRNDKEMFEFMMVISELHDSYYVTVDGIESSPYSCDSFSISIEK